MISLSATHAAARAAAALEATLTLLNSGTAGATLAVYASTRPAQGAAPGAALATFTLPQPAGSISAGVLTLGAVPEALILTTGTAVWARFFVDGAAVMDCDVSDTAGTAELRLAATQLYAGGSLRLTAGLLG